ncbi:hypothetical protein UK12_04875 [Saccharothrix sp. ST-888]|nr:hypothetical protein UK12_04875 [Saccharothrix sp. ST-888]
MTRAGRYRWRTSIRRRLPWFLVELGFAGKGAGDCGTHEWYNRDGSGELCYHCTAGKRPFTEDPADSGADQGH